MTEYAAKLRRSGYGEKYRRMVIRTGGEIYKKKVEQSEEEGGKKLYRSKDEMKRDKDKQMEGEWVEKRSDGRVSAPLILNPTVDGVMIRKIRKVVEEYNKAEKVNIKVVERGGSRLSANVKSNPLGVKSCWNEDCAICRGEGSGGHCRARGPVYEQR